MKSALRSTAAHVFVDDLSAPMLNGDDEHHLIKVLRLRAGEVVSAGDGRGAWRLCRFGEGAALDPLEAAVTSTSPPRPLLTIGFAVPKGDRPEWIVQKLTELGIDRIVPLRSERTIVTWDGDRASKQLARLRRVAREAAMQSRRLWLPEVEALTAFSAFDGLTDAGTAIAEPAADPIDGSITTAVIGPEGGWSDAELQAVARHVSLGSTVLRTETAAIAAGVRMCALRDERAT